MNHSGIRLTRFLGARRLAVFGWSVVAICLHTGCSSSQPDWVAYGQEAMVAADHPLASRAGADVLRAGGNAVDAAVAVSFALAVTRPQSTGLGGGGFLIYRNAETGEVAAFDYREMAPGRAAADMFEQAIADNPTKAPPSRYGHLAAAVPGLVAGLSAAHEQFGTMEWAELVQPAIELAECGFAVDEPYVDATQTIAKRFDKHPELRQSCPYVYDVHLKGGKLPSVGDTLSQPQLAKLLKLLAEEGAAAFYRGPVADTIENEMRRGGGVITASDLASYRVRRRTPLTGTYRDYDIIAMPPPSSGGICVIEALNVLESFDVTREAHRDPAAAAHLLAESMKHAFADRARWLGDSDYVTVPTRLLTSKPYAAALAGAIDADRTGEPDTYGAIQIPDDSGTSHFSIVDRWGNCVVSTETINTEFGSLAAVGEWGLILNNEMDDFAAVRDQSNAFGLLQSERNAVAPGKRPLSSMSPTIILKDNQPVLMLGGSGGPRIITSVLNVIVRTLDLNEPLATAMSACRIHHQWSPDAICFDQSPLQKIKTGLEKRGHVLSDKRKIGVVQAIHRTGDGWCGASDPRKQGRPNGY